MSTATKYNWTRKRVAERWGLPFWDIVQNLYDLGFNRTKAACALGMERCGFNALLRQNPHVNPWGSSNVIANYVRDTGEPFVAAIKRMQKEGYSLGKAARALGYLGDGASTALKHAMRTRGVFVKFEATRPVRAVVKKTARGPNMQKGWPTWVKVYEICNPQTARNRNEGATVEDSCDSVTVPQVDGAAPLPMTDV